jgi:predicted AAA+ superfamily ATPase
MKRTLLEKLVSVSQNFPVLLITGPRQVGKTYLLESAKEDFRNYVTLDNIDDRALAKENPALFIQRYAPPVIIDEIQYAPELFPYIKIYVDKNKKNGSFWITGSQKFALMKGVQESLAGRVAILDLLGFSLKEMENKAMESVPFIPKMDFTSANIPVENRTLTDIYNKIWRGAFPQSYSKSGVERDIFFRSYLQTYIERDIRDDLDIRHNEMKFYNFIRAVAVRTGNLLNYSDIAKDVEVDVRTAKVWLNALIRAGLVKIVEPYFVNISKRMIKTPKIYFLDTGLCSYLARIESPQTLEASYINGRILETFAFTEILKSYWHNGREAYIYFYRDKDDKEIDFIIERDGLFYPIEVKKTASPTKEDAKNLHIIEETVKNIGLGAVVCLRPTMLPLSEKSVAIPIWDI